MRRTLFLSAALVVAAAGCSARATVGAGIEASVLSDPGDSEPGRVWVCHRGRWQDVAAPAAQGHSRHGDRVSESPREARSAC